MKLNTTFDGAFVTPLVYCALVLCFIIVGLMHVYLQGYGIGDLLLLVGD